MTFRERLRKDHPELVNEKFEGGCSGCPNDFDYEGRSECERVSGICRVCWDREMSKTNEIFFAFREVIKELENPFGDISAEDLLEEVDKLEEEYGDDN